MVQIILSVYWADMSGIEEYWIRNLSGSEGFGRLFYVFLLSLQSVALPHWSVAHCLMFSHSMILDKSAIFVLFWYEF